MTCPYLDYRREDGEHQFDHRRPYCGALGEFVSPMKADICNDRFEFDHCEHCEVYKQHAIDDTAGMVTVDEE